MAKTNLFSGTGAITPGDTASTFTITDLTALKTIRIEGAAAFDVVTVVVQNRAADGWEPLVHGAPVELSNNNRSATPCEFGVFSVEGNVSGTVTIYTEDGS